MIVIYIPIPDLDKVKNAMFEAGAGKLGNYDCCAWQTLGQGQFKPLTGSKPFIGKTDQTEHVDEYKVEMICQSQCLDSVISALKQAHPYEQPAFYCWEIQDMNTV